MSTSPAPAQVLAFSTLHPLCPLPTAARACLSTSGSKTPMSNTMPGQETGDSAEAGPRNSQLAAPGYQLPNKSKGGTVWWLRGASARPVCSLGFTPRFLRFELLLWTSQFISNRHTACTQATALAPIHAELQLSALGTGASLPASPAHTSPQDAAFLPTRCQHPHLTWATGSS